MEYNSACSAVRGVAHCAASLRLANSVGAERAKALELRALEVLENLEEDGTSMPEAAAFTCQLATDCIDVASSVDEDLASSMMDCFDQTGLIIWGFSVEVAQCISFSLAAIASLLAIGSHDMSVPSHRYAKRAPIAPYLELVASELDRISVHVYGALCRFEVEQQGSTDSDEQRLVQAFQSICLWNLTIMYRFEGSGSLATSSLWEWASADPLWALVLVKGVLSFQSAEPVEPPELQLMIPDEFSQLKDVVISALCGLHVPDIAFSSEMEAEIIADDLDGGFTMAQRLVGSDLHRSRLALGVVDCNLLEAILRHAEGRQASWVPALTTFLAALVKPIEGDHAIWAQVIAQEETHGSRSSAEGISSLVDAEAVIDAMAAEASGHSYALWQHLLAIPPASATVSYFLDCASLAYAVPPAAAFCRQFLDSCLQVAELRDTSRLVAFSVLAANSGLQPSEPGEPEDLLASALAELTSGACELALKQLEHCRAPVRRPEVLQCWVAKLGTMSTAHSETTEAHPAAPEAPLPPSKSDGGEAPEVRKRGQSLRELLRGAPAELCCALDGKLLVDPVRSPHGHVFERSSLARALASAPGACPLTGAPLLLEDCQRAADLRLQATRWVRQAKPMQRR